MDHTAFLAIWSDVPAENEVDYLHWLTREHTAERLSLDGFHAVRVYRALDKGVCRYLIHYDLASPAVLDSEGYLRRLNAPTPWSQRVMPNLGNFIRGGGQVSSLVGSGHGGVLAAARLHSRPFPDPDALRSLAGRDLIVAASLLTTDTGRTTVQTKEKAMRGRDGSFAALVLVEGLTDVAVRDAMDASGIGSNAEYFSQVFQL